jgi:hypothetical protein
MKAIITKKYINRRSGGGIDKKQRESIANEV